MGSIARIFRSLTHVNGGMASRWVPLAAVGLAGALALLFIHIFVVMVLAATVFVLGKRLVEWALGPGTRIRLNIPWGALAAKLGGLGRR